MLKPKLFSIVKHRVNELPREQLIKDIISGIIVAVIAIPLSIALAIASGVTPEKGLITAIIAGFLISFLGGSRVQIGGPTGAFVVIVYGILARYGSNGLTVATIMAGMFMIFFGLMRFGTVIKYIPYPITTGFTSGIAIVLFSTEIKDLLGLSIKNVPSEFFQKWGSYLSNLNTINLWALVIGISALLIMVLWPKFNKIIPGSLVALVTTTIIVNYFNISVATIGSTFGEISNSISIIDFSKFNLSISMVQELIRPAMTIAFLASIESLLSAVVADSLIGKKHNSNMELIAQGVANIASAIFGGIPATGAIARTAANVKNGGRTPIAGVVHALFLLIVMLILMPYAKLIPMTTLAAILIVVAYNMSEWRSFKGLLKSTNSDIAVLLVTFVLTVVFDLVTAIEIGMIIAMFLFVRRMADITQIHDNTDMYKDIFEESENEDEDGEEKTYENLGTKILLYELNGPLFFGAANSFIDAMNAINSNARIIIFNMKAVSYIDATAYSALKRIDKSCRAKHVLLLFSELNAQPLGLLEKLKFKTTEGEDRFFDKTEEALKFAREIITAINTSTGSMM